MLDDTFLDRGGMCVAMVTTYYSKNVKNTAFQKQFKMKFGIHVGLEVKMSKTVFQQKFVAMVTTYYAKIVGRKAFQIKFGTIMLALKNRCARKKIFDSGGECVAMVMACYAN